MLTLLRDIIQTEAKLDTIHRYALTLPRHPSLDECIVRLASARHKLIEAASQICVSDDISSLITEDLES